MDNKQLLENLKATGQLDYGASISVDEFRLMAGIEYPSIGTKQQFDSVALLELAVSGYIRDQLLTEGKYFKQEKGYYRVAMPSENEYHARNYEKSADRKLLRATKLRRSTPNECKPNTDQDLVRTFMKRESIKGRKYQ